MKIIYYNNEIFFYENKIIKINIIFKKVIIIIIIKFLLYNIKIINNSLFNPKNINLVK